MKHLKYIIGFALGAVLFGLFLYQTDLPKFYDALKNGKPLLITIAVILTVLSYVLRAWRWHYLVRPIKPAKPTSLFEGIVIGFTVSGLLPGRLGELARPLVVARKDKMPMSSLFATVVVDRILDGSSVLLLLGLYLALFVSPETASPAFASHLHTIQVAGFTTLGSLGASIAFLFLLRFRTEATMRLLGFFLRPLPPRFSARLTSLAEQFAHGLSVLQDFRGLAIAAFLAVLTWVEIGISHYYIIRAFDVRIPFTGMFFLLALMVIGVSIPTPGAVGGLHWSASLGLTLIAPLTPKPNIDAAAMGVWGNSFFPVVIMGLFYIWKEGLSLASIQAAAEQET